MERRREELKEWPSNSNKVHSKMFGSLILKNIKGGSGPRTKIFLLEEYHVMYNFLAVGRLFMPANV